MDLNRMSNKDFNKYVGQKAAKSPLGKNMTKAFVIGGLICVFAQGLKALYAKWGADEETSGVLASITLIVLASLLTGLGVFDKLAKHAGAGTLVPITGFSNAMTAPALEFKSEGLVLGTGVRLFTVAGPVLVYGFCASIVYGILRFVFVRG